MENCIYYFSGTGNSLQVAQDIAGKLDDCEVLLIPKNLSKEWNCNYKRIGFVFPVYAWGPPLIVTKFISQLNVVNENAYIYAVVTYRDEPGAVLEYFSKMLQKRGLKLHAGFGVSMPGNHIAHYETDTEEVQKEKFEKWNLQLTKIASALLSKTVVRHKKSSLANRFFQTGILYRIASRQFPKFDKKFISSDKCNGCGICEKVCLVDNIAIKSSKPMWKHNCEQCLACLHWCPQQAIEYGEKTIGRQRYQNSNVSLRDMIK